MITHYKKVVVTSCEHFPELIGAVGFFDAWKHVSPRGYKTGVFAPINGYSDILLEQYYCTCKYTPVYEPSIFDYNCKSLPKVIITDISKQDGFYYKKSELIGTLGYFYASKTLLAFINNQPFALKNDIWYGGEFYPFFRTNLDSYQFFKVRVQELKGKTL